MRLDKESVKELLITAVLPTIAVIESTSTAHLRIASEAWCLINLPASIDFASSSAGRIPYG